MYGNILSGLGQINDRINNRGINSKVELKMKLMEMSQYIGMDYDTLLDKFKDEYNVLPVSSDDSLKNIIEEVLPMFGDMIEKLKTRDADSDNNE